MSRYTVTTTRGERTDDQSVLGFGPPLRTFFLQAFADPETGPELWLGTRLEEYPTLEDLVAAARAEGCEIRGLSQDAIVAMLNEAGRRRPPSVGERHGLIFLGHALWGRRRRLPFSFPA